MKLFLIVPFFIANYCVAQQWQAEVLLGMAGYSGDLTEKYFVGQSIRPGFNLNLKYVAPGNHLAFRLGLGYVKLGADDKKNTDPYLLKRNLNFKTELLEANLCAEVSLFDLEELEGSPYVLAGIGLFKFDPYTYDKNNIKTYLQPLGTEGQGLSQYPDRRAYSLTQFCIPLGAGWKFRLNDKFEVAYELSTRILFTDYLDDVSKTYADPEILLAEKGATTAELSYRGTSSAGAVAGTRRGNSKSKDQYYFTGLKITMNLGRSPDYP